MPVSCCCPVAHFFVGALLISAYLMQAHRVAPFATVPFGILMIMVAMWMLSGSTSESGADDMMAAILLRGLGLGFLFLSITLIAFSHLNSRNLAGGIGLFNTGRQLGGLIGVAGLQTLIDHNVVTNAVVLGANVTPGGAAVIERMTTTTAMLSAKGMDAVAAGRAATSLLGRLVTSQSTVIAFDTAFVAVALLFVIAAPTSGRHQDRIRTIRESARFTSSCVRQPICQRPTTLPPASPGNRPGAHFPGGNHDTEERRQPRTNGYETQRAIEPA